MGKRRLSQFKQLAFDTAVRNPERYKEILAGISNFEGRTLTDECILEIMTNMYEKGIVTSKNINLDSIHTREELKSKIKEVNATRNADGGYPKGYQSRFWTYMRTLSEFCFVLAPYNASLKLSLIAKKLINNELDEQEAFAIQAMKYNRKSPYRNVSNDFNYFRFIVEVLVHLGNQNRKLSFDNFILSMFHREGNLQSFLKEIEGLHFSDKNILKGYIETHYGDTNRPATIFQDYPDVVIRMLRITGFITLSYKGKLYLSLNEDKMDFINALLAVPFEYTKEEKTDPLKYFQKSEKLNDRFLAIIEKDKNANTLTPKFYSNKLEKVIKTYQLNEDKVVSLIEKLNKNKSPLPSEEFKYIPDPLKLEFYISLLVYMKYGNDFNIKPNYKMDSVGMPISHAPGNQGDIEIYDATIYWLLEVTLIRNKTQQINNETTSVIRHLITSEKALKRSKKYLSLVAPVVHLDTHNYYENALIQCLRDDKIVYLKPYNLSEFIEVTKRKENLKNMEVFSQDIIDTICRKFSGR
jgi:hypothetical protein